jgi:tRNA A37 threonylcarbamoyladenosine biosynthesis protein TsaE
MHFDSYVIANLQKLAAYMFETLHENKGVYIKIFEWMEISIKVKYKKFLEIYMNLDMTNASAQLLYFLRFSLLVLRVYLSC